METQPGGVIPPQIVTESVITEDTRTRIVNGGMRGLMRSPRNWIGIALLLAYGMFFASFSRNALGVVVLVVMFAIVGLLLLARRAGIRRSMTPLTLGTVMRCEFRSTDFTFSVYRNKANPLLGQSFLSLRTMAVRDYSEIRQASVNDAAVNLAFTARSVQEVYPRELFPDHALALISRYAKVIGKWTPVPAQPH